MISIGISLVCHNCMCATEVTAVKYRNKILARYIIPYAGVIGEEFVLMDDNARPHRARLVGEYFEDQGFEQMERPTQSLDYDRAYLELPR